jgi:hypothetical protein
VGGPFEVLEMGTLPGEVVVTKDGGSVRQDFVEGVTSVQVQGKRCEIFHDDEIDVLQGATKKIDIGVIGGVNCESGDDVIDTPLARHGDDLVSERRQGVRPLLSLNRHAIGQTETETDDCQARHGEKVRTN